MDLLCNCSQAEKTEKDSKKTNLLFILTLGQRYDTSLPYGNENIKVPNLNHLGEEGIVFRHAYVSQPVCSSARATLQTGLYPHSHGVVNPKILFQFNVKILKCVK